MPAWLAALAGGARVVATAMLKSGGGCGGGEGRWVRRKRRVLLATGLENLRTGAAMTDAMTDAMQVEHRGSGEHSSLKDHR